VRLLRPAKTVISLALLAMLPTSTALAAGATVAVAPADGPKKSGAEKIERAVRVKLVGVRANLHLVTERALAASAKQLNLAPSDAQAAKDAGADLLIVLTVKKVKKKLVATGLLIDVANGNVLKSSQQSYGKGGAEQAGDDIGDELAKAAAQFSPGGDEGQGTAPVASAGKSSGKGSGGSHAVLPKEESDEGVKPTPVSETKVGVLPKDEAGGAGSAATTVTLGGSQVNGERKLLQIAVGSGMQIGSAYTVAVQNVATGLAYNLGPLLMFHGGARVLLADLGLGFELNLSYAHVKYAIDVNPPVTSPSGGFLDFGANAFYQLTLARFGSKEENRFFVAPLLGVAYNTLSVDKQTPYTVVVGSSALAPSLGARVGVMLGALEIEASGRLNLVVSYSESPTSTGSSGGGIGTKVAGGGRYWLNDFVGVSFALGYEFMRVGLKGAGNRTVFMMDPPLMNATVYSADVKLTLGVVLAI
jgi:hypothetical protein